jgi:glucosamine-6-phosphate deaminase
MDGGTMNYRLSREELFRWCAIPRQELSDHPELKLKLEIGKDRSTVMNRIGQLMADEVIKNNLEGKITRWVLPAGPTDEYEVFIARVNKEKISLKNLWIFHMDEFLDWEGRPYPIGDTYESLEGTMDACFYNRIDEALTVPLSQRIWPRINDIDFADQLCEKLGGIDTIWAGVGANGLIGFCESPRKYWHRISLDEYAISKTRIVDLQEDTIVALSHRTFGACYDRVPPRAITIGCKIMLSAKKAVLMVATGNWKKTVVRIAMFSEPTLEYPVTLLPRYIPEVTLYCDDETIDHPMSYDIKGW